MKLPSFKSLPSMKHEPLLKASKLWCFGGTLTEARSRTFTSAAKKLLVGLTVACASASTAIAACNLNSFNTVLNSTGTGPFNTSDTCTPGGTAHTAGNDACSTDNVVRSNDTYVARFNYRVNSGALEQNITFRSTLPQVSGATVVTWDGLPSQCTGPGSSLSGDGLTLTCNIGNVDRTTSGDLTSALLAQVKVSPLAANATQITNVQGTVTTDECTSADNAASTFPTVELSARPKVDFRKDYTYTYTAYEHLGVRGYLVGWYVYMDQYDPSGNSSKGGAAIQSPVTLRDVPTNFPPNAVWFDCGRAEGQQGNISCPAQNTPVSNGTATDLVITARPGEENQFLVAGGLNTNIQQDPQTSNPARLATFYIRYFIPRQDILNAGGQINLRNDIPPAQILARDTANNPYTDSLSTNNGLTITVTADGPGGGVRKYVARQWGSTTFAGATPGTPGVAGNIQMQGGGYYGDSGTGLTYPNEYFYPRVDLSNPSAISVNNSILCDAFNSTQVRLAEISTISGHAATEYYANATNHQQPQGRFPSGYVIEYGVAPTQGGPGLASRCDDGDATWFANLNDAAAAGQRENLNRVRVRIPELAFGQTFYLVLAQQTRPGVNGTIIPDYLSARSANLQGSSGTLGDWYLSSYDAVTNNGVGVGKRLTLTTANARILKEASITVGGPATNQATAGNEVVYTLTPSLNTVVTSPPSTFVTIVDTLPSPLSYVSGSAQIGGVAREPDSIVPVTGGTALTWTLNNVTPNVILPQITFRAFVPQTTTPNAVVINRVEISSPEDVADVSQRTATKSLTVLNPPGLYVNKIVANSKIDPNGTAVYSAQISNFENNSTTIDSIDVLPYIGDGRLPATSYNGSRGLSGPVVSSGGGTARYSNRAPATILFDPVAAGNTADVAGGWCLESEFATAGCPANFAAVTAWRVTGTTVGPNSTVTIDFQMPTAGNNINDQYTNRFYTKSSDPTLSTLRSNDVRVTVELGSLSGSVYIDQDRTATRSGTESGIQGVQIALCLVAPVSNACPSGQEVRNPMTNAILTTTTDATGAWSIGGVPSNTTTGYYIIETPPAGFVAAPNNLPGSLGGTSNTANFSAVRVPVGANGTNYNFGHSMTDLYTTVTVPATSTAPGATVNASVTIGNSSFTDSANTQVTLTLNPNLTGVVITPPAGWQIAPGGAYNSTTGIVRLIPTDPSGVMVANSLATIGVAFTAPEDPNISLRSDIQNTVPDLTQLVNPVAMTNPNTTDPNRNAHIRNVPIAAMTLDVIKRAGTPRPLTNAERSALSTVPNPITLTDNAYMIPYRITVANKGEIPATNVQLSDRLDFTYPSPARIVGVFQANSGFTGAQGAALVAGSHPNCQPASTAYNGTTQPNLLSGSFNLPALPNAADPNTAAACTLEFTVVVTYGATPAPQTALRNTAIASANNNPNNPGPTAYDVNGVPTFGAPGHRVSDLSTDSPQVPPQPYPGGNYPDVPPPGSNAQKTDTPLPTPVILGVPQQIDVRKSASVPVQLDVSGKRFRVAYSVNVTNTGTVTATNVQLSENLKSTFLAPASYAVSGLTTVSGSCPVNTAFDGGVTQTAAGYNLIGVNGASSHTMNPNESCVLSFVVDVNYGSGTVPTTPPQNLIYGSTALGVNTGSIFNATTGIKTGDAPNMIASDTSTQVVPTVTTYGTPPADPGRPTTANGDTSTVTPAPIKSLEVLKRVRGPVQITGLGQYLVPYTMTVTAVGTAGQVLPNVQVIDNLVQTFRRNGGTSPAITVQGHQTPIATNGAICPAAFTSFNGDSNQRFFAGNTPLTVGQSCEFRFDVLVNYGTGPLDVGPHLNTAYASSVPGSTPNTGGSVALNPSRSGPNGSNGTVAGTWTPPAGAIAIDASTDSTAAGVVPPSTSAGDVPLPTPVSFSPASPVTGVKFVENLSIPGAPVASGQRIQWTIAFKNEGPYVLTGVQVTDTLHAGLTNAQVVSVAKINPAAIAPDTVEVNASYNGASNNTLLAAATRLEANQSLVIKLQATIRSDFVGQLTNQANLNAVEWGGATGQLQPTSAINSDSPVCPSTQACRPAEVPMPPNVLNSQPADNNGKGQANQLSVVAGGSISGQSWFDANSDRQVGSGETPVPGLKVALYAVNAVTGERVEVTNPNARPVTGADGRYQISGLSPTANGGPQYEVVFYNEAGVAVMGTPSPMATNNPNNGQVPASGDRISKISVSSGQDTPAQNLPLDPSGVVYDSITREPVPGAVVTFSGPAGFDPAVHLLGGAANVSQTVGSTGFYQFILLPSAPAGQYSLSVTPPAQYVFPSTLIPVQSGAFTPPTGAGQVAPIVPNANAPQIGSNDPTTYYTRFVLTPGSSMDVVHNHIPLDPRAQPRLVLAKSVNKPVAELGDVVGYTLLVRNIGTSGAPTVRISDRLPAGFRYIPGTTQLAVGTGGFTRVLDPIGGVGPALTFTIPGTLAVNGEARITYRVRIAVGALQGDGINRARANSGNISSNEARAKVKVDPGVFTNEACVAGKVFVDCNNNHIQDAEELGIPGVRLYLQDGTHFTTDSEGKYSYCGLPPNSSVLKLDMLTMPPNSRPTTTTNRNLGDALSVFLDPKGGQLLRADFAEGSCTNPVLENVKARRTQGEVRASQTEKSGTPARKFEGKSVRYPQQGTDSANQDIVKPAEPANGGPSVTPQR